jgi:hypothetical protein
MLDTDLQRPPDRRLCSPEAAAATPAPYRRRRATVADLTTRKRKSIPKSEFGLPDEHKYPMPDKAHARNAKARASQQKEKGNLTGAEKAKIDRKADRILDK